MLSIILENFSLPFGLESEIMINQAILKFNLSETEYYEKILAGINKQLNYH